MDGSENPGLTSHYQVISLKMVALSGGGISLVWYQAWFVLLLVSFETRLSCNTDCGPALWLLLLRKVQLQRNLSGLAVIPRDQTLLSAVWLPGIRRIFFLFTFSLSSTQSTGTVKSWISLVFYSLYNSC
jgi:hypothetical protein